MWKYRGHERPSFAEKPGKDQESVWDYPRPPRIEANSGLAEVNFKGKKLARSKEAKRVLETASPPGIYIPEKDVDWNLLVPTRDRSICEWKGVAKYWALASDPEMIPVAWSYPNPTPEFMQLRDYISFYPGRVDCFINGEKVLPQPGQFYGGWITRNVTGPFKGEPGTGHW